MAGAVSDRIIYVDGAVRMWATTTPIDWHQNVVGHSTDDPLWNVYNSNGHDQLRGREWLLYTLNGERWKAKMHAEYNLHGSGTFITTWFEHCNLRTGDCHDDTVIHYQDWQGRMWEAEVEKVAPQGSAMAPRFIIRPLTRSYRETIPISPPDRRSKTLSAITFACVGLFLAAVVLSAKEARRFHFEKPEPSTVSR